MSCHGHSHDHDHEDTQKVSLWDKIDLSKVYCLNEEVTNSGRDILKAYSDRFNDEITLKSPPDADDDEDTELLLHVSFSEAVNIHSLSVRGKVSMYTPPDGSESYATAAPSTCKIFCNRTDIDFDMARELTPTAVVNLASPEHMHELLTDDTSPPIDGIQGLQDGRGEETCDYTLRPTTKFKYVNNITLFFGDNYATRAREAGALDDDTFLPTEICYVGFKGVGTSVKRQAVETVYESRGMKKDHKVPDGEMGARHLGM